MFGIWRQAFQRSDKAHIHKKKVAMDSAATGGCMLGTASLEMTCGGV